jgi:hypothetical protein
VRVALGLARLWIGLIEHASPMRARGLTSAPSARPAALCRWMKLPDSEGTQGQGSSEISPSRRSYEVVFFGSGGVLRFLGRVVC